VIDPSDGLCIVERINLISPMKNTASLAQANSLIDFARANGLNVRTETENMGLSSWETTIINATRPSMGWRDEWVQVIVSVCRRDRTSVRIATQTNWKVETVRGLWSAQYSLGEIVKGLAADKARAKADAEAREQNAAIAETRRCLCA
jgi:hypothetical protein